MNIITSLQPILIPCFILYHVEWRFKLARKKGYYHIVFIDQKVVNCTNLCDKPAEIFKNLYKYLSVQHYKAYILFSYNFS